MDATLNDALVQFAVKVLVALLAVGLTILGDYLRRLLAAAIAHFRAATTAEQRTIIDGLIRTAVRYAEQTGLTDTALAAGAAKKSLALRAAQEALDQRGLHLDVRELDRTLEAMVLDEFNRQKAQSTPAVPPAPAPAQ